MFNNQGGVGLLADLTFMEFFQGLPVQQLQGTGDEGRGALIEGDEMAGSGYDGNKTVLLWSGW